MGPAPGNHVGGPSVRPDMRRLLVLPLLLLALAACGDDDEPVDAGAGSDPAETAFLDGRTFVTDGPATATPPLVAGTVLRLSFADGQVRVDAGCNQMSGEYSLEGGKLVVGPLAGTEMGCDPERMDQDTALAEFFAEPITFAVGDDFLSLAGTGDRAYELTDEAEVAPVADLVGPTWRLTTIVDGAGPDGTASSVPDGVVATVVFGDDGQLTVNTGCNEGGAAYTDDGGAITLTDFAVEQAGCTGGPGEVETAVLAVLGDAGQPFTAVVDGQGLTLTAADGAKALGFTVEAAPTPTTTPAPDGSTDGSTDDGTVTDAELVGPTWTLTETLADGVSTPVPDGIVAYLDFEEATVAVASGCNTGGGPYTEADGVLTFGPVATTRRGCGGDEAAVENAVLTLLVPEGRTATWSIDGPTLTLTSVDGARGLTFTAD